MTTTILTAALDSAIRTSLLAQDVPVTERAVEALVTAAYGAIEDVAASLSDEAHYKIMRSAGSNTPCLIVGCRLSMEEHHRLAYGMIAESRELKRRVTALENGQADA